MTPITLKVLNQMDLSPCNGCDECGLRCAAGVQMTRPEYQAVLKHSQELPVDELIRVLKQDKQVDLGDGVTVQMCRYRDMEHSRCIVYPARPLICRLLGHLEWLPCPIEKVEKVVHTADALELMQEYAAEPRQTFERWDEIKTGGEG